MKNLTPIAREILHRYAECNLAIKTFGKKPLREDIEAICRRVIELEAMLFGKDGTPAAFAVTLPLSPGPSSPPKRKRRKNP